MGNDEWTRDSSFLRVRVEDVFLDAWMGFYTHLSRLVYGNAFVNLTLLMDMDNTGSRDGESTVDIASSQLCHFRMRTSSKLALPRAEDA